MSTSKFVAASFSVNIEHLHALGVRDPYSEQSLQLYKLKERQVELTLQQVEQVLLWLHQPLLQPMPLEFQSIPPEIWEELEDLYLQVLWERRLNPLH